MIEEIKKEIIQEYQKHLGNSSNYGIGVKEGLNKTLKILDKYDKQPNYKSAFEELKRISDGDLYNIIKSLEQKYNLGGE